MLCRPYGYPVTQPFIDNFATFLSVNNFDDHLALPLLADKFNDHLALLLSVD